MKSSWSVRCSVAVCVLALGGCPDTADDLGPDGDLETGDASVSPVGSGDDASAPKQDATTPTAKDAATREDARVEDAGTSHADAGSDAGTDAGSDAGNDAGTDAGQEPSEGSFADVYPLIVESCAGCHGAGKPLDLSTPELAHAGLVGVIAQYPACVSDGGVTPTRVIAGDADNSLLIAKLEGTQSCGKQMPPKALLEAEKIAKFRAWVEAGAPQ